jgi:hypothetical protein
MEDCGPHGRVICLICSLVKTRRVGRHFGAGVEPVLKPATPGVVEMR